MYYDEKSEVDSPLAHVLTCRDHAGVVQLADAADQAAAAHEDLALAAGIAGKCLAHHLYHVIDGELGGRLDEHVLAGLVPDAASEIDVLLLVVVPQLACGAKEERLLHAQAHVIDRSLFLVAHRPAHLFVG